MHFLLYYMYLLTSVTSNLHGASEPVGHLKNKQNLNNQTGQ